ncbi:MAG: hypothetical protein EOM12_10025 [Verrucomicrobiae bacterium]|nr:hypothetical protein [Verrucomicrobiae bacterium]
MKCPECGTKMKKDETSWECPDCGYYQVKSYYAKLEEQNARFLKNFLGNDDIPEGCAACGNPAYPQCQDGCPLFDD